MYNAKSLKSEDEKCESSDKLDANLSNVNTAEIQCSVYKLKCSAPFELIHHSYQDYFDVNSNVVPSQKYIRENDMFPQIQMMQNGL